MSTAGFVLTGGKSARMGRDKALLTWRQRPLVEHIARCVFEASGSVTLVGAPERYGWLNLHAIADSYSDRGPLAGIEAALSCNRAADYNLVVACDLPDLALTTDVLQQLLATARRTDALCFAAQEMDGLAQPLCAVYRADSLPVVKRCLFDGQLRLREVFNQLRGETMPLKTTLTNVNSPEDWLAWQTK